SVGYGVAQGIAREHLRPTTGLRNCQDGDLSEPGPPLVCRGTTIGYRVAAITNGRTAVQLPSLHDIGCGAVREITAGARLAQSIRAGQGGKSLDVGGKVHFGS